jgi:hypothetical protein
VSDVQAMYSPSYRLLVWMAPGPGSGTIEFSKGKSSLVPPRVWGTLAPPATM